MKNNYKDKEVALKIIHNDKIQEHMDEVRKEYFNIFKSGYKCKKVYEKFNLKERYTKNQYKMLKELSKPYNWDVKYNILSKRIELRILLFT
ncbi:hypothetical protein QI226_12975 [Staphylococcus saprophyticus]|nr:hypothetical protein [Staphylococcus saprophyticus]